MTFENTNLVAIGDSFFFGHYENDINYVTCWERSWVSKLEKIGNFKSSINLGAPGGSNLRSFRMLLDFLDKTYNHEEEYIIIYGLTELNRTEFWMDINDFKKLKFVDFYPNPYDAQSCIGNYRVSPIGSWQIAESAIPPLDPEVVKYLTYYFGVFSNKDYLTRMFTSQLLAVDSLMKHHNIKYYFMCTCCDFDLLEKVPTYGIELPEIKFLNKDGARNSMPGMLGTAGFKQGWCQHYDHDGNEFLANYIHDYIKGN